MPDPAINESLWKLVEALRVWSDAIPIIKTVFLFGSRVRGDHRPDSDVDVFVEFDFSKNADEWMRENDEDFADLKARLPGRLSLRTEKTDVVLPRLRIAAQDPVFVAGKVICVSVPKYPGRIERR